MSSEQAAELIRILTGIGYIQCIAVGLLASIAVGIYGGRAK